MSVYTEVRDAAKLWSLRFVVEGSGQFPYDMLRYDSCYPVDQNASARIEWHYDGRRRVHLQTEQYNKNWQPNVARWRSFGWQVLPMAQFEMRPDSERSGDVETPTQVPTP